MKKLKFNPFPYLILLVIIIVYIITFKEDIKEFSQTNTNTTNTNTNTTNNSNNNISYENNNDNDNENNNNNNNNISSIDSNKNVNKNNEKNESNNNDKFTSQINNNLKSSFVKATVKRVVDGDTIVVLIDNVEYKVRFIGINSPEYTSKIETYGKEATDYTTQKLKGKTVYLEKDVSETDKYDRLLRYVWLEIPNEFSQEEIKRKMFNSILVLNGYAQAATYPPDVKYSSYFKEFEKTARNSNAGLWNYK